MEVLSKLDHKGSWLRYQSEVSYSISVPFCLSGASCAILHKGSRKRRGSARANRIELEDIKACANCNTVADCKKCNGCMIVSYCNKASMMRFGALWCFFCVHTWTWTCRRDEHVWTSEFTIMGPPGPNRGATPDSARASGAQFKSPPTT